MMAILPTVFLGSLIFLNYDNLIERSLYFIQREELEVSDSFSFDLARVRDDIKYQLLLTLGLIIILTAFSFVMIYKEVVLPLKELIEMTKEVRGGNLDIHIKKDEQKKDEIGELADSFNNMVQELKENKKLLEKEKGELQKRVDDLEKFHKLTIGREMKMVKLKEELEKLKKNSDKK